MGQVPDDLDEVEELDAVEAEVGALRERTQRLVAELERRLRARAARAKETFDKVRHAADLPAQLREHPRIVLGVSTMAAVALGIGVYVTVARIRARRSTHGRLARAREAVRGLLHAPERYLARRRREPLGKRLLAAALIAGASTIVRSLSLLLVKRATRPDTPPPLPEHRV
jgi:hypothetical protein